MVTSEHVVKVLNEMLESDAQATNNLFNYRVKCNQELAEHPTVQVKSNYTVGLIGVINGLLGEGGEPFICITTDDTTGDIVKFNIL